MTIIYRTPNVIIDRHEWHAVVHLQRGRASLQYRFRPLSAKTAMWQPMSAWAGPKPKGMCETFWRFRSHVREALGSEGARKEALAGLRGRDTGAQLRNPGKRATGLVSAA